MQKAFLQITPEGLHRRMKSDSDVTVLDVRSPAEYQSGHIVGAHLAPLNTLTDQNLDQFTQGAGLRADNPLYLTCHAGVRATQAAELLRNAGLKHLVLIEGGTESWKKSGLPIKSSEKSLSIAQQTQIAIGGLIILKVIFGFTVHELFFVAAAAIGAGLITAGITRWCGMERLLANMPWNRLHTTNKEVNVS